MNDTKEKLLEAAERLFSQQGFDATSLRQIIAEAGVNLAAIHYHFGSKDELLAEVITRGAAAVNEERLRRLDEMEASGRPLTVEGVLDAFLTPVAAIAHGSPQFVRLMGRIYAEGLLIKTVQRAFQPVVARFMPALERAVPHLPREEFGWRVHFMVGAMAHTMCMSPEFIPVKNDLGNLQDRIERLIRFLAGGFLAAAPVTEPAASEVEQ